MTTNDIVKLKYATILVFIGVAANASSKLNAILIIEAMVVASIISVPLLLLLNKFEYKLNQLSTGLKRAISMLSVPVGLVAWRWLHSVSVYYETLSMFVLAYALIAIILTYAKKHKRLKKE